MRALTLLALLLPVVPALGQTAPAPAPGRYALTQAECRSGEIFLTLAKDRLDLPVLSCTGLAFTPEASGGGDRERWSVSAKACTAEGEEKPAPKRFRLEARGTALRILWADGTNSAWMARCGR
ncbi:MAG: hypothetical protein O9308_02735 [Beijerinckiaceae bacterium]|nr:hypothetical protein [Beijerinckiaceae bacterium]